MFDFIEAVVLATTATDSGEYRVSSAPAVDDPACRRQPDWTAAVQPTEPDRRPVGPDESAAKPADAKPNSEFDTESSRTKSNAKSDAGSGSDAKPGASSRSNAKSGSHAESSAKPDAESDVDRAAAGSSECSGQAAAAATCEFACSDQSAGQESGSVFATTNGKNFYLSTIHELLCFLEEKV